MYINKYGVRGLKRKIMPYAKHSNDYVRINALLSIYCCAFRGKGRF